MSKKDEIKMNCTLLEILLEDVEEYFNEKPDNVKSENLKKLITDSYYAGRNTCDHNCSKCKYSKNKEYKKDEQ